MKGLLTILFFVAAIRCEEKILQFDDKEALNVAKKYLPYNPVILDSGAYIGAEIKLMKNIWPSSIVYAFEPVPEIFKKLKYNTEKLEKVFRYQLGLDSVGGKKTFYLANEPDSQEISQSSSLREPKEHLNYSAVQFNRDITIECFNLDEWAEKYNVKNIDMLWFDMQGVELEVMKAAPKVMKNVKVVYTEVEFVELYKGQALWSERRDWLESQGFYFVARDFDFSPESWFGNAIFARR